MNTVVDWPTIATDELPPKAQTSGAISVADLTPIALARFGDWKAEARRLVETYRGVVYDCRTPKGREDAEKARAAVRAPRYAAQRVSKASKSELAKVSKAVGAEEQAIIAYLAETEEHIDAQIRADDARREAEKSERERIEAARKAKHEAGIATICSYADSCAGLSSDRIAAGIAQLEAIPITESWEDFKERADLAKLATLARMAALHTTTKQSEDEAARLEAQRIENERIAAEQAAERQRIAEAAAKVKADAEALQQRINEQAEREAKAKRDVELDLQRKAEIQAEFAANCRKATEREKAQALPEAPESPQVLKAEPATADATDRDTPANASPDGGPMCAAQPAAAGRTEDKPLYAPLRASDVPKQTVTFTEPEPVVLRFEGYSDDTFGEVEYFKDDYDNCASGKPIEYLVTDPATGLGIVVTGQHCPGNSGSWLIGVANHDPEHDDRDFPRWPMRIEAQDYRNGFQPSLVIEAPAGVTIRCLQHDD